MACHCRQNGAFASRSGGSGQGSRGRLCEPLLPPHLVVAADPFLVTAREPGPPQPLRRARFGVRRLREQREFALRWLAAVALLGPPFPSVLVLATWAIWEWKPGGVSLGMAGCSIGWPAVVRAEGLCQAGNQRAPGRGAAAAQPAMSEADGPARSSSPSGRCAVEVSPSSRALGRTGRHRCWRRDDMQTPGPGWRRCHPGPRLAAPGVRPWAGRSGRRPRRCAARGPGPAAGTRARRGRPCAPGSWRWP